MSPSVCAALIWKRIVSSPRGTTGIGQADGEDAAVEEAADHRARAVGVAHEQRHDRVRPGDRLEAERLEAAAELRRARLQVGEPRRVLRRLSATSIAVDRRRAVRRAERVGVDVGVGLLAHRLDRASALPATNPPLTPNALPNVPMKMSTPRAAVLLGAAAGARRRRAMPCESSMTVTTPSRKRDSCRATTAGNRVERRVVAAHAEDAVEDDDHPAGAVGHALEVVRRDRRGRCACRSRAAPTGTLAMRIARMMQL